MTCFGRFSFPEFYFILKSTMVSLLYGLSADMYIYIMRFVCLSTISKTANILVKEASAGAVGPSGAKPHFRGSKAPQGAKL